MLLDNYFKLKLNDSDRITAWWSQKTVIMPAKLFVTVSITNSHTVQKNIYIHTYALHTNIYTQGQIKKTNVVNANNWYVQVKHRGRDIVLAFAVFLLPIKSKERKVSYDAKLQI